LSAPGPIWEPSSIQRSRETREVTPLHAGCFWATCSTACWAWVWAWRLCRTLDLGWSRLILPLRLLAEQGQGEVVLQDLLPRLQCRVCGDEPATVVLVEMAASSGPGGRRQGWRIELR